MTQHLVISTDMSFNEVFSVKEGDKNEDPDSCLNAKITGGKTKGKSEHEISHQLMLLPLLAEKIETADVTKTSIRFSSRICLELTRFGQWVSSNHVKIDNEDVDDSGRIMIKEDGDPSTYSVAMVALEK